MKKQLSHILTLESRLTEEQELAVYEEEMLQECETKSLNSLTGVAGG